jgi:hypothetical protein
MEILSGAPSVTWPHERITSAWMHPEPLVPGHTVPSGATARSVWARLAQEAAAAVDREIAPMSVPLSRMSTAMDSVPFCGKFELPHGWSFVFANPLRS